MFRSLLLVPLLACAAKTPPAAPAPPEPATSWAGRVSDAKTVPEPLTSVLRDVYDVRLLVTAAPEADGLSLTVASTRKDGTQDLCAVTTTLRGLSLGADGAFSTEIAALPITADRFGSQLVSARISGTYAAQTLTLSRIDGLIDTATFVPRMGKDLPAEAVCNLLPALGPCVPCEGSAGPTCWAVSVSELPLSAASTPVQLRDQQMICADPSCSGAAGCPSSP